MVDLTKSGTSNLPATVEKHYHFETLAVALVILGLIIGAVYLQTHNQSSMASGFTTCALLLGLFKFL